MRETVVVLGASPKPERYSNKAVNMLKEHDHDVIPIHPAIKTIDGIPVTPDLASVSGKVDTVSVYVNPQILKKYRRYAIIIIFILAAILTPPDPTTQVMLAIPLVVLYEFTIWISYFFKKKKKTQEETTT